MSEDLVLSVSHLSAGYRDRGVFGRGPYQEVLHDVDFVVRHGEILGLVGESGTGKSTLARCILGLLQPDSGSVTHYTKRPQIVFQDPYSSLNPAYTVERIMEERSLYSWSGKEPPIPACDGNGAFLTAVAAPIPCQGDVLGLVLFLSADGRTPGEAEQKLAQTVASFLGQHMEN